MDQIKGAFVGSLTRTSSQIKNDRAESIADDAETSFRRKIEDMKTQLKKLQKSRKNSLDMSPDDINTIISGKDFDSDEWVDRDIKAGVAIRNLKVRIEIAEERFDYLFGDAAEAEAKIPAGSGEVTD